MFAIRGAVSRFFAESGFFLAAGLAFFFLICCIPLTLLGVSTLGFVLSTERAADEVVGQLARNFPVYRREIAMVLMRIVATRALPGIAGPLVLGFVYRYVPRRQPARIAALPGAILTALLWEVAKQLFRLYIRRVGVYDQIYGPLGVLIAFVMFVYYTCLVFVFGAAYVAALDARRAGRE